MSKVITPIYSAVIIRIITVITVIIVAHPGLFHCFGLARAGCAAEVYNGLRDLLDVLRDDAEDYVSYLEEGTTTRVFGCSFASTFLSIFFVAELAIFVGAIASCVCVAGSSP